MARLGNNTVVLMISETIQMKIRSSCVGIVAMLFIVSVITVSYANQEWSEAYRQALALGQKGEFDQSKEMAHQAWELAQKTFGLEDVRTYGSEALWLSVQIFKKFKAGEKPDQSLVNRMRFLRDKTTIKIRKVFNMTWSYGETAPEWPRSKHIILTFFDYPHYHEGFYSPDLADYLESFPSKTVPVTFEVTYNPLGELQGYYEVQIGDLKAWKQDRGYAGSRHFSYPGQKAEYDPSPWGTIDVDAVSKK